MVANATGIRLDALPENRQLKTVELRHRACRGGLVHRACTDGSVRGNALGQRNRYRAQRGTLVEMLTDAKRVDIDDDRHGDTNAEQDPLRLVLVPTRHSVHRPVVPVGKRTSHAIDVTLGRVDGRAKRALDRGALDAIDRCAQCVCRDFDISLLRDVRRRYGWA